MTRNIRIASLTLASVIVLSAASAALAHGGGHVASSQHNPVYSGGGGKAVAAKSVNLGGLSKFVLSNALKGGKLVGGSLKTLGGAMAGPGKCPGGVCGSQL